MQRLHPRHGGSVREALGQLVFMRGIACHQLQQEISAAADHVALPHLRPGRHKTFEGFKHRELLAFQPHDHEKRDLPAELMAIGVGVVAFDISGFFQAAHPAQAGWGRNSRLACQLHIGHAPVLLQFREYLAVYCVKRQRFGFGLRVISKIHSAQYNYVCAFGYGLIAILAQPLPKPVDAQPQGCPSWTMSNATWQRENVIDVAIIGGGPAGIAAAQRLKTRGVARVVILERETTLGGALLLSARRDYGLWQFGRLLTGPAYAARLVQAALAAAVEILPCHEVTALRPNGVLEVATPDGLQLFVARRVLLTGKLLPAQSHLRLDAGTRGAVVDQYGRCSDLSYFATGMLVGTTAHGAATGDYIADDLSGGLPSMMGKLEVLAGQGIHFVVPQCLAHVVPLRGRLELCAAAAKGQLRVRAGEVVLYRRRVDVRRAQRLIIDLRGLKTPPDEAQLIVEIVA